MSTKPIASAQETADQASVQGAITPAAPKQLLMIGLGALALNISTWGLLYMLFPPRSGTVFLHYSVYFGVDQVGAWSELLWLPISGSVMMILHSIVIVLVRRRLPASLPLTIAGCTVVFQVLLLIALWFIIDSNL